MKNNDDDVVLLCEYCGAAIDINKHKCPSCGADCSKIIKKHKDEKKKKAEQEKERILKTQQEIASTVLKTFSLSSKIVFIVFGVIFVVFIITFVSIFLSIRSNDSDRNDNKLHISKVEKKPIKVGFNELAKNSNYTLILDSYELYNHVSDNFPQVYNTKEGYQKIAFHFVVENKKDSNYLINGLDYLNLTADDYVVESADLEVCIFCYTTAGKDSYEQLLNQTVRGNSKLQGYVGFEVPVDKKKLSFSYDNITITMDNPAYQG